MNADGEETRPDTRNSLTEIYAEREETLVEELKKRKMLVLLKPQAQKRLKTSNQNGNEKYGSQYDSECYTSEARTVNLSSIKKANLSAQSNSQTVFANQSVGATSHKNIPQGNVSAKDKNVITTVNGGANEDDICSDHSLDVFQWEPTLAEYEPRTEGSDFCDKDKEESWHSLDDLRDEESDFCNEERDELPESESELQDEDICFSDEEMDEITECEGDLPDQETDSCDEEEEREPEGGLPGEETESCDKGKEGAGESEGTTDTPHNPDKEKEERHTIHLPVRPVIVGNRICDILHVIKSQNIAYEQHKAERETSCSLLSFELYNHRDYGLRCYLTFRCKECNYQCSFWTSPDPNWNVMSVAGSLTDGKPYENEKASFNAVNVPYMSFNTYMDIRLNKLHGVIQSLAEDAMREAADEEKMLAVERGDVVGGIPKAPTVSDGAWGTRQYAHIGKGSLGGYGVIVGQHTGKVLAIRIKNKFCVICEKAEKQGKEPRPHKCFKNWPANKPSSLMEAESIKEAFETSVRDLGLIFDPLITDRDSSVINAIRECNPYASVGLTVKIVHCRNHLCRNIRKRIDAVKQMTGLGRIPHLREVIEKNKERLVNGILYAARKRREQDSEFDTKCEDLRNDILAMPYHGFKDHSKCGSVTICKGASDDEENETLLFVDNTRVMFESIVDIFDEMSQYAESFLLGYTNNPAEGVNSVSNKNISGKRVCYYHRDGYETRQFAMVLQCNTRKALTVICSKICGRPYECIVQMETDRAKAVRRNYDYRNNKKAQGQPVKNRKKGCKDAGVHYGPDALRPDMSEERYQRRLQMHYELLFQEQSKRVDIAQKTLLQSGSSSWFEHRRIRLTASYFGEICRQKSDTCPLNLLKRIQAPPPRITAFPKSAKGKAMKYGRDMEKEVKKKLIDEYNWPITDTGLVIDPQIPFLAASPDALYGDDGIVEIKCSYAALGMTPQEAVERNVAGLRRIYNTDGTMRKVHKHYHQVMGTMKATGRKFCKFVLATQLVEGGEMYLKITDVEFDEQFWNVEMAPKLFRFYEKSGERELLDQQISRKVAQEKAFKSKTNSSKDGCQDKQPDDPVADDYSKDSNQDEQSDDPAASNKKSKKSKSKKTKGNKSKAPEKDQGVLSDEDDVEILGEDYDPRPPPQWFLNEIRERELIATDSALYKTNVLSTAEISGETLDAFLQILRNESGIDALSVMWLQCPLYVPVCEKDPDAQILGGLGNFHHWMTVHYNGYYVLVYDSMYAVESQRTRTFKDLPLEVRLYVRTRYPNVPKKRVICLRVRQRQPDGNSCGVRAAAFATSVALGETPWLRN